MWAFVTKVATVYVIRPSRGRDVPQEVLGADYDGRMIHDGWSPYDSFVNAIHQQCLEHLLRRAKELLEKSSGGAGRFPRKVKQFLCDALALRDRRDAGKISTHGLAVARGRLEKRLDRLLDCKLSHEGNRRFDSFVEIPYFAKSPTLVIAPRPFFGAILGFYEGIKVSGSPCPAPR
jgi:hypothetical protein